MLARMTLVACLLPLTAFAAGTPVKIAGDDASFTISNSQLTAVISKKTGDLTSLKFHNLEMMGHSSGHPAGYWEQNTGNASQIVPSITIDPASNGGERGEVSIKGVSGGKPLGGGGPGGGMLCDLELRYALGRDDSGVYAYAVFSHPATYGRTQVGESRFGAKLNGAVFDWLSIDARRNKLMASGADWDRGSPLNMKEARRLTTGVNKGQVEHKYDYSAVQFKIPAFGWSSTKEHVGLYFINPSMEYLSGGATHVELTGHLDDNTGGDPTLLDYWRGTHYGGSNLPLSEGEEWTKVVGPIFIYLNSAADSDAMYRDAMAQAAKEAAQWPYAWVHVPGYASKAERAAVSGQLAIQDPTAHTLPNLLVGLAYPDSPNGRDTWQNDAKHYQFWVRGSADGRFRIPNVQPGTYELHAIADGILGEFAETDIVVEAGKTLDLGKLKWKPVRYGRQLWEIGIPNRSGEEFFKGDDYFHWGWYLEYPKLFPNDVTYSIGKSDYRKDWFFEQVPHATAEDPAGRGTGRPTTWTIGFPLIDAPQGRVTLRLALAGVSARRIDVAVNDAPAGAVDGLVYNATINRDGIQGEWVEKDVTFDAALLKPGENTLKLTVPGGGLTSGIIYDYLRLEAGAPSK
jgi:rhamnogalacturonan endolyase